MDLVDTYKAAERAILQHCGYEHGWAVYPLQDQRGQFWGIHGGCCYHSPKHEVIAAVIAEMDYPEEYDRDLYSSVIRGRPGVYRGAEFTLVCEDTQTDGNVFLSIYQNDHEVRGG
jgi:hypothetical protein